MEHGDGLAKAVGPGSRAAEGESARGAVEGIAICDQDTQRRAARDLVGNPGRSFFDAGGATVRVQQDSDAQGFARSGFALLEPSAINGERLPPGHALNPEGDALDIRNFESVRE